MTFRILSLDGGGVWALLQAMALEALYPGRSGHEILGDFDLSVANSGGAITLAGLMADHTPARILGLFDHPQSRESIFVRRSWMERLGSGWQGAKYSTRAKLAGLSSLLAPLGGGPMSGLPGRAMIVGFDYDRRRAEFFRTFSTVNGTPASAVTLAEAVHASTNAPVIFFDEPAVCTSTPPSRRYWDGAVGGYNNPVMAGVVEALSLGARLDEIQVRSIGAGTVRLAPHHAGAPPELRDAWDRPGLLTDLKKIANSITDDPPDAATYTAHVLLGGQGLVRLNPVVQPIFENGAWRTPAGMSLTEFDRLANLGMDAVEQQAVDWIKWLGRQWIAGAAPNQPIRFDPTTLGCRIGDPTFAAGAARW